MRLPGRPGALPIAVTNHVPIQFGGTVWTEPQIITLKDHQLTRDTIARARSMITCHRLSPPQASIQHCGTAHEQVPRDTWPLRRTRPVVLRPPPCPERFCLQLIPFCLSFRLARCRTVLPEGSCVKVRHSRPRCSRASIAGTARAG